MYFLFFFLFQYVAAQVKRKFDKLNQAYKNATDSNRRTGSIQTICPYFDRLENIASLMNVAKSSYTRSAGLHRKKPNKSKKKSPIDQVQGECATSTTCDVDGAKEPVVEPAELESTAEKESLGSTTAANSATADGEQSEERSEGIT